MQCTVPDTTHLSAAFSVVSGRSEEAVREVDTDVVRLTTEKPQSTIETVGSG